MSTNLHTPALQLLEAANQALINHPDTTGTGRQFLAVGASATWDQCDCDGQLWVRVSNLVPSGRPWPQPLPAASPCTPEVRAVTMHLGVIRCIATVNDRGQPPTALEVTNDGINALTDAACLYDFLTALEPPTVGLGMLRVDGWQPLGPMGGCAGGEWTITVGV